MKKIFVVTALPVINFDIKTAKKTAGNQSMYNMLKYYNANNYRVCVYVLGKRGENKYEEWDNISFYYAKEYKYFENIIRFVKWTKKIIKGNRKKVATNSDIKLKEYKAQPEGLATKFEFWYYKVIGMLFAPKLVKEFGPDIIYGYEVKGVPLAKALSKKFKLPLVTRFQGTSLVFYDSYDLAPATAKIVATESDLVIMTNDGSEGERILQDLGVEKEKVRFWINGLHDKETYLKKDKTEAFWKTKGIEENATVICTSNRLVDWKRTDKIVRVFMELQKRKSDMYLFIIGDGPEREYLERMISQYKIENVVCVGSLEHEEAIEYLANADLNITLNYGANLGNSIIESLALGVPVCIIGNESSKKIINENVGILLEERMNEKEMAEKIYEELLADKFNKQKIKEYAQNEIWSWEERMNAEIGEIDKL